MARVTVTWDEAALAHLLWGRTGPVVRHVAGITRATTVIAKTLAPVDTGVLRASIAGDVDAGPGAVTGVVQTPVDYAIYQHQGTGIYGARGRPITPVRSQYLVFTAKDGKLVFAKSVKGVKPVPFLVDALRAASPYPVVVLD